MARIPVLFVCLGNICRSPMAEAVFRDEAARRGLSERFELDSCGTGGWNVGEAPDPRTAEVAAARGLDVAGQRARQLNPWDYRLYRWMIPMDRSNEEVLHRLRPEAADDVRADDVRADDVRIVRLMEFVDDGEGPDVPDPYFGGGDGFEHVFDLLSRGVGGLMDHILETEGEAS